MKHLLLIGLLVMSGCSSIPTCGTKSIKLQLPSAVPFMGNEPFVIERSNVVGQDNGQHVKLRC